MRRKAYCQSDKINLNRPSRIVSLTGPSPRAPPGRPLPASISRSRFTLIVYIRIPAARKPSPLSPPLGPMPFDTIFPASRPAVFPGFFARLRASRDDLAPNEDESAVVRAATCHGRAAPVLRSGSVRTAMSERALFFIFSWPVPRPGHPPDPPAPHAPRPARVLPCFSPSSINGGVRNVVP